VNAEPVLIGGRYEVVSTLGQGSFGRTFLAKDRTDAKEVAIKLLDARGATDWKAFELFEREASVLQSLRHHGVPEVFDSFRDKWEGSDAPFLVMEYVEGTSLSRMISERQHLEHDQVMHVLLELLGILEYLHGRVPPILHRDIKPPNIIVRPNGFPALVDFGSVRRVFLGADEAGSTIAGTYGYMPYEQYMGQATPASDLYAVAATMLHLVTGRAPKEFMNAEGRIEPPADLPGDQRFRDVIARMLRPAPLERFQSAHEVRKALLSPTGPSAALVLGKSKRIGTALVLPDAPRQLQGVTKDRFNEIAYSWWIIADSDAKNDEEEGYDLLSWGLFGLLCVATAGIMPAIFISIASARKKRLRRFFVRGAPAVAIITGMKDEPTAFGAKLTRVSYDFEADGEVQRDSDTTLPVVAGRWKIGDQIEILYIPEKDYDSVIVSG
jgi:serine/threonine protein kinase